MSFVAFGMFSEHPNHTLYSPCPGSGAISGRVMMTVMTDYDAMSRLNTPTVHAAPQAGHQPSLHLLLSFDSLCSTSFQSAGAYDGVQEWFREHRGRRFLSNMHTHYH